MPKSLPLAFALPAVAALLLTGCAERTVIHDTPAQGPQIVAMVLPPPQPPAMPETTQPVPAEEAECLAKAVYFEARGEAETGKRAVAAVVLNRVSEPEFPDTICGVVRQGGETPPCQFSWWCDGKSDEPTDEVAWSEAVTVAHEALEGRDGDPTDGALFFHHTSARPGWRRAFQRTVRIGPHIFYRAPGAPSAAEQSGEAE